MPQQDVKKHTEKLKQRLPQFWRSVSHKKKLKLYFWSWWSFITDLFIFVTFSMFSEA